MTLNSISINILILHFNDKNILLECIKSIFGSDYNNYSITVIDNGSTDGSVEYIKGIYNNINHKSSQGIHHIPLIPAISARDKPNDL